MRGQRILVAGGAGFVGSALVRALVHAGARVAVLDNFQTGTRQNLEELRTDIDIVTADLLDEWSVFETLRRYRPEMVFNLAADSSRQSTRCPSASFVSTSRDT